MKKFLLLVLSVSALIVFGCTKDDSPTNPGGGAVTPTNVTLTATVDGYGVIFGWTAVTNADSYEVEYPGNKGTAFVTGTSYTHNDPTTLGTYRVRTYYGSDVSTWSSTKSTAVYTGSDSLGEWTNSSYKSCYYWTTTGSGVSISCQDPNAPNVADIFCYIHTKGDMDILIASEGPLHGIRQTAIAYDATGTLDAAPTSGTNKHQLYISGNYWVRTGDGRYVKLDVTEIHTWHFMFTWRYQPVQGFRYTY